MAQLVSMRDQPGTQREYETIYILKPDCSSEQIQAVNDRVKHVIEEDAGKLLRVENWGKRKLAYEVAKQNKGIYLYWRYLAPGKSVSEVERNLRMLDTVIRFLTVKVDEDVDPDARPSDVNAETFVEAATTRPDEEDLYLGRGSSRSDESSDAKSEAADDAPEADEEAGSATPADAEPDGPSDGVDAAAESESGSDAEKEEVPS